MSALGCSLFTLTIGRSFKDFLAAFFATIISQIFLRVTRAGGRKYFMETLIGGLIATIFALIFSRLNLIDKVENVIVGSILILFPGLSLTNAVRDIMNGDMVSGMVGFIHAIFVAIALALGVGIMIKLNVFLEHKMDIIFEFVIMAISVVSFAYAYNIPPRSLLAVGLTGGVSWIIYSLLRSIDKEYLGVFLASLTIGTMAIFFSKSINYHPLFI